MQITRSKLPLSTSGCSFLLCENIFSEFKAFFNRHCSIYRNLTDVPHKAWAGKRIWINASLWLKKHAHWQKVSCCLLSQSNKQHSLPYVLRYSYISTGQIMALLLARGLTYVKSYVNMSENRLWKCH